MPTVEQRYDAAIAYVQRAIEAVGSGPIDSVKTAPVRSELARIDASWLRASSDTERTRVARDAELLADRTEESLPGAPQDRARSNLFKGEHQTSTAATSYTQEVASQAGAYRDWIMGTGHSLSSDFAAIGKWLLAGGALVLGIKIVSLVRERQPRRNRRSPQATRRLLNRQLELTAESAGSRQS